MSDIRIERAHNFDLETARQKAKQWLLEANQKFGLDIDYQEGASEDVATIKKAGVNAKATLNADKIAFSADLAFLAKPLKGPIQAQIQEGLDRFFA